MLPDLAVEAQRILDIARRNSSALGGQLFDRAKTRVPKSTEPCDLRQGSQKAPLGAFYSLPAMSIPLE
ncbi:MAG: hypothetical protein FJZ01_07275 [Candidatus Sericytochromatia bacterium]|nr:hypothetical protein [Candidatus Tanganyikabacteria bacterium]